MLQRMLSGKKIRSLSRAATRLVRQALLWVLAPHLSASSGGQERIFYVKINETEVLHSTSPENPAR